MNDNLAAGRVTLTRQHLDQLALSVARHAGHADDFAGLDLEVEPLDHRLAIVVVGLDGGDLDARVTGRARSLRRRRDFLAADHHPRHLVGAELLGIARAGEPPAPQHRDLVGEGHHLAELVGDHQDRVLAGMGHVAQHAENLVGLLRREHRGRLVENQEAALEIDLLEDLDLLLLARRDRGDHGIERHLEGHAGQKRAQPVALALPIDHRGQMRRGPARDFRPRSCWGPG